MRFVKMNGTGNDFVVIDNRDGAVQDLAAFARAVCPRALAIGADGVLALEASRRADVRMRIINADGSEAEMCGNGLRCVAVYAATRGVTGAALTIESLVGVHRATAWDDGARVSMTDTERPQRLPALAFADQRVDAAFQDTGVPHTVVPVADVDAVPVVPWGRTIRQLPQFAPAGTNANFMARGPAGLLVRTYERGVEDETLACGTGACAAAMSAHVLWGLESPVTVQTRSGESLTIHFTPQGGRMTAIELAGPVHTVYTGELAPGLGGA